MTTIVLLLLFLFVPSSSSLTHSKLSVHSGPSDGNATSSLVAGGQPRVIKLLDSFGNADKYKSQAPNITVIGRVYLPSQPQDGDPTEVRTRLTLD